MSAGLRLRWLAGAAAALLALAAGAAEVSNLRLSQRDGRLVIDYDLDGAQPAEVVMRVLVDGRVRDGRSLRIDGQIGAEVPPGKERQASWHVLHDFPQGFSGDVAVGLHVKPRRLREADLNGPSDEQAEVFRRIDGEYIDFVAGNRRTVFAGAAAGRVAAVDERLQRAYFQVPDLIHLEKSRYYCARFHQQSRQRFRETARARAGETVAPADDFGTRWAAAKAVQPTIDDANHATYLDCLLRSLDPHSTFLSPDAYRDFQASTKGRFAGIGIEIASQKGVPTVVSPIDGTPAHRAGLRAGDRIVAVDGRETHNLPLAETVKMLRGERGARVTLSIQRGDAAPFAVDIERDTIAVQSVRARPLDGGYGYIRLKQFQETTADDFFRALESLRESAGGSLKGLVLDLRNDPGGLLTAAVRVAGRFIEPNAAVVSTRGRERDATMQYRSLRGPKEPRYPVVVLINSGSASAAEIVAGALQDYRRAVVVGTRSFGKGSVQTVMRIDDAAIKLTTSLYYTPAGRSIHKTGIEPDIALDEEFPSDDAAAAFGRRLLAEAPALIDPELREALVDRVRAEEFSSLHRQTARLRVAVAPLPPPEIVPRHAADAEIKTEEIPTGGRRKKATSR